MDLITLQEYKNFYSMSNNPAEDFKISILISSVSALIQSYIGRSFDGGKTVTETISIDYDTDIVYLNNYPVSSILSVSESNRYTYDSTVHVPLTYSSEYTLDSANGALMRHYTVGGFASWPISPGYITVTYITGDSSFIGGSESVPADLKLACIYLVSWYKNDQFVQSKTIQGTSTVNTTPQGEDFPKHIQVLLDRYR